MNKPTIAAMLIGALLVGGAILFTGSASQTPAAVENIQNVTMVNGTQVIEIRAKGGYQPRKTVAKAGVPTLLKLETNGTFDCSSAVRIPSMSVSKNLPPSGTTEIDLGTPQVGTLQGVCAMGMYSFTIDFKEWRTGIGHE